MTKPTNFELVSKMNAAFGNPKGDPLNINKEKIIKQMLNIPNELAEFFFAAGGPKKELKALAEQFKKDVVALGFEGSFDLKQVRDSACDVNVFSYGGMHLLGVDGDRDMEEVVSKVMTRFIKNEEDKAATIAQHAAEGVVDVYFEGEYPTMIMKSARDQPDAPKGKFMKSASFFEPVFYDVAAPSISIGIPRHEVSPESKGGIEAKFILDRQNKMVSDEAEASRLRKENPDA